MTEKKEAAPKRQADAKVEEKSKPEAAPKSAYAVVSGKGVDDVKVSVNREAGKSLSVHHIQRRLVERGYPGVYGDRDGFWKDATQTALEEFAGDRDLDVANLREVLESLFENDSNVRLVD